MPVTAEDLANFALENIGGGDNFVYYRDLLGVGTRAFPYLAEKDRITMMCRLIAENEQMWHDVGRVRPAAGMDEPDRTLYLHTQSHADSEMKRDLPPRGYLQTFREYMKRWAERTHVGDDNTNWFEMQRQLAEKIKQEGSL